MKIAVASRGESIDSPASPIFGRCAYFIIADIENGKITNVESLINSAVAESGGAGIKAAQTVANKNIKVLISGSVGPNAYDLLKQVGTKIYQIKEGSVQENINFLMDDKLEELPVTAIAGGHAGRGRGRS
ncbi:NifB/NifX family molybdenum-iron cluster-binding protein [Methanobacterium alcaliphilum]|uniref:NifB/NifX family molybdenum-iron cluster-binding protein n=1 Tax=Methanobacterium alcaliphilum TaxID=392018 RepID=UPI00200A1A40|nr:NifB/NifX family molybdenum-iron cluster-binding protein [Methanobacterium alcaliphilum]MCK9151528.1 NifB/NifX family molybdenum-iron cluster-binding protein [Methanobacterium alcaliphilum]